MLWSICLNSPQATLSLLPVLVLRIVSECVDGEWGSICRIMGPYHSLGREQLRTHKKKFWEWDNVCSTFCTSPQICNFPAIDFWHNVHDAISENWPRGGAGKRACRASERPADSHIDCITRTHAYANPEPLMLPLLLRPREGETTFLPLLVCT